MKLIVLFIATLFLSSCGSEEKKPAPAPAPVDPKITAYWQNEMKPLIKEYCIQCHATSEFVSSGKGWTNSNAKSRVQDGSMPPPGSAPAQAMRESERLVLVKFPNQI